MASSRFTSALIALTSVVVILTRTALLDFAVLTEHVDK
jgi:hypothetical protein